MTPTSTTSPERTASPTPREAFELILEANNLTARQVAKEIGVHEAHVSYWRSGKAVPGRKNRRRIEVWSEGRIPSDVDWNEPISIPVPAALPSPEAMLCWCEHPQGIGIERLRQDLRLTNLVGWKHLARQLNVATAEDVAAAFRGMGYFVVTEPRRWRERTIMIHVPCTPLLPYMMAA
jgi:hypothetical protein